MLFFFASYNLNPHYLKSRMAEGFLGGVVFGEAKHT